MKRIKPDSARADFSPEKMEEGMEVEEMGADVGNELVRCFNRWELFLAEDTDHPEGVLAAEPSL